MGDTVLHFLIAAAVFAPLKYRWVYLQTNFFRPEAVDAAIELSHRASKAGYNGIVYVDSKLESQNPFPGFYEKSVRRFLDAARADHIDVIPGILSVGWADGMLANDPSLVESLPCRKVALTAHNQALQTDSTEFYSNGDFKSNEKNKIAGSAFQDAPGVATFVDDQITHGGTPSLRIEDPKNATDSHGNCRLVKALKLQPFHQYRLSFWAKSQNFASAGDFRALALTPEGASLSWQDAGVTATADWALHSVVFNTLDHSDVSVYLGVWGGSTGKLWLSSISLRDVGLLNVDRRELCPVHLKDGTGRDLAEGKDFASIADPKFGTNPWQGEFDFTHDSPSIPLPQGSGIKEGDTVYADYYAAASTETGKTAICLSDPGTAKLERTEVEKVDALFGSPGYMLAQDEMRIQGWCGACEHSGLTTAQILANDIKRSVGYLKGKQAFVWSDMFDPSHNAVANYYSCKGSLAGDWKGLPEGTVIVNWNSGKPHESLSFFHGLGFSQILAGYYDGDVNGIKPWMAEARNVGGLSGVMYTTWAGKYDDLEAFAKAAWGG